MTSNLNYCRTISMRGKKNVGFLVSNSGIFAADLPKV